MKGERSYKAWAVRYPQGFRRAWEDGKAVQLWPTKEDATKVVRTCRGTKAVRVWVTVKEI